MNDHQKEFNNLVLWLMFGLTVIALNGAFADQFTNGAGGYVFFLEVFGYVGFMGYWLRRKRIQANDQTLKAP